MAETNHTKRRIIIIGKVGAGKSTVGNAILSKESFKTKLSFAPVTNKWEYDICKIKDREYFVVDTPGVNGLKNHSTDAFKQLNRILLAMNPGFHGIVLTINGSQTIDETDLTMYNDLIDMLGEHVCDYLIIVFAGVEPDSINGLLKSSHEINELCTKSNNRVLSCGVSTVQQIRFKDEFVLRLETIVKKNIANPFYYHKLYDEATKILSSDEERKNAIDGKSEHFEAFLNQKLIVKPSSDTKCVIG